MKNINITINYFGAIAEITSHTQECMSVQENQRLEELHQTLLKKYDKLKTATYKLAYNQAITEQNPVLNDQDELALLPPFAGG